MKNRILKISAYTGLAVTAVYTVLNLLCLAFSFPMIFDNAQPFSQAVIGLDGFTWHVYGVFALTTLIINLFYLGEDRSAHKKNKHKCIFGTACNSYGGKLGLHCIPFQNRLLTAE